MNSLTQFKKIPILPLLVVLALVAVAAPAAAQEQHPDQVLEWNQIFIDTLIATNTPNSSSQRLGAIVAAAKAASR